MALYQNGILVSGANQLPQMTMAEYLAIPASDRPTYWICTDRDYDDLSADNVTYGSGSVADALDDKVSKSGDTINGNLTVGNENGTASEVGSSWLVIGNNKAEGTEGNSKGVVRIFGKGSYRATLQENANDPLTANRDIYLPNKGGTLALTSDIPIGSVTKPSGSSDSITINIEVWSRYGIMIFGNANGSALYGVILIQSSSSGYVSSPITVLTNDTFIQLTVTKNNDDSITVSGLPRWGYYTLIAPYGIS